MATKNGLFVNADVVSLPHGGTMSKVEKFDWGVVDNKGSFSWIAKGDLHVDLDYQRLETSHARILNIASNWSWVACATLAVAKREDGGLWVIDGQHRKMAADLRSDVTDLPCMVYLATTKVDEAKGFLAINVNRGVVKASEKWNAMLMAEDPVALKVKSMIEADGYEVDVTAKPDSERKVRCLRQLLECMRQDERAARVAWELSVKLFNGLLVTDTILKGLFTVERHLAQCDESLLRDHYRESLLRTSVKVLLQSIQETNIYRGGGPKACGEGIIRILNKNRRSRRISSLYHADE